MSSMFCLDCKHSEHGQCWLQFRGKICIHNEEKTKEIKDYYVKKEQANEDEKDKSHD